MLGVMTNSHSTKSVRQRRTTTAFATIALLLPFLAGCGIFVPTAPNEQPLSMTLRDGEPWFHWCGEPTKEFGYILIEFSVYSNDRVDGTAAEGEGRFRLKYGDEFSVTTPPMGVDYTHTEPVPVTDTETSLFVNTGEARGKLGGVSVIFEPGPLTSLKPGQWLYPGGEVSNEPCGMRNASPAP